ncbi:hypothetical protein [Polycladidibacter stylochi]|nr:hypothetical protein [Pseudovibrio stylochi]
MFVQNSYVRKNAESGRFLSAGGGHQWVATISRLAGAAASD